MRKRLATCSEPLLALALAAVPLIVGWPALGGVLRDNAGDQASRNIGEARRGRQSGQRSTVTAANSPFRAQRDPIRAFTSQAVCLRFL
jgi:hypothetical protein